MDKSLRESSVDFQSFISAGLLQILGLLSLFCLSDFYWPLNPFKLRDILGRRGGNILRSRSRFMIAAAVFQVDT